MKYVELKDSNVIDMSPSIRREWIEMIKLQLNLIRHSKVSLHTEGVD